MDVNYAQVADILRVRQTKFIECRTVIANEVTKFFESLKNLDPEVIGSIQLPADQTPQAVLSALWEEPFDEAKYTQQLNQFQAIVTAVKTKCDELNQEALACLQNLK